MNALSPLRTRIEIAALSFVAFVAVGGCRPPVTAQVAIERDEPGRVSGRVVDEKTWLPSAGVRVVVGASRATTDAEGRFTLRNVPPSYELALSDAAGASLWIYRGLRRRDPLVIYEPPESAPQPKLDRRVELRGEVVSGGPFPIASGLVTLNFYSSRAQAQTWIPDPGLPGCNPRKNGPGFGPLRVYWEGPPSIDGELVAFDVRPGNGNGEASYAFGSAPVTLTSPAPAQITVRLAPVPTRHVSGEVSLPPGGQACFNSLRMTWFLPSPLETVMLGGEPYPKARFEQVVPDLRGQGGSLCVTAYCGSDVWIWSRRCGVAPDGHVALALEVPPALARPMKGTELNAATELAWTSEASGIFELQLEPSFPTRATPSVRLFTTESRTAWPESHALDVASPAGLASYKARIGRRGPYASLDELAGPEGVGARIPKAQWSSEAGWVDFTIRAPERVSPPPAPSVSPASPAPPTRHNAVIWENPDRDDPPFTFRFNRGDSAFAGYDSIVDEYARWFENSTHLLQIEVAGYADAEEPEPERLAIARAEAVRAAFVHRLRQPDRFIACGHVLRARCHDECGTTIPCNNGAVDFKVLRRVPVRDRTPPLFGPWPIPLCPSVPTSP